MNLQTFEIINYIIVLPICGHDSIICLIQLHAPIDLIQLSVSMNNIVRHLILIWLDAFYGKKKVYGNKKVKMSFKVALHMVC